MYLIASIALPGAIAGYELNYLIELYLRTSSSHFSHCLASLIVTGKMIAD